MLAKYVVVMGPYRSGTSLVSQILRALGVDFGPPSAMQPPPNRQNPGGYLQRPDVVARNIALIEAAGGTEALPRTPEETALSATVQHFSAMRMDWPGSAEWRGIKDPRFSITLSAWIRMGVLDVRALKVVTVSRAADQIANSVLAHDAVRQICGDDRKVAREMIDRYLAGARWHVENLGVPGLRIDYGELVSDTEGVIRETAAFMGVQEQRHVSEAIRLVGKRGALMRHYRRKLLSPSEVWDTTLRTIAGVFRRS